MCKDKHAQLKRRITRAALELDDFRALAADKTFHALLDATEGLYESAIGHLASQSQRPNSCVCVDRLEGQWSTRAVGHPAMEAARNQCLTFRKELWLESEAAVDCFERAYCLLNLAIKVLVELELAKRINASKKEPTPSVEKVGG